MITTLSKEKRSHAKRGDILVDDFLKYRCLWEEMGGIFIHHKNAADSIREVGKHIDLRKEDIGK